GFEDLVIQALCTALRIHPYLNATVDQYTAHVSDSINVSVAVALPTGLVTPTIFSAEQKSVREIAEARRVLLERARQGKLSVREMTRGTITISNLGTTGVRFFTPCSILLRLPFSVLGKSRIVLGSRAI